MDGRWPLPAIALALFLACDDTNPEVTNPEGPAAGAPQGGSDTDSGGSKGARAGSSGAGATSMTSNVGEGGAAAAAGSGGVDAGDAGSATSAGASAAGASGAVGVGDVAGAAGAIVAAGGAGGASEVSAGSAAGATGIAGAAGAGGDSGCGAASTPPPTLCDGKLEFAIDHVAAGNDPYSIVSGYLNCDANLDLVVTNVNNNYGSVSVLLGNGDGTFEPAVNYSVGGYMPRSMAIGRFDGDDDLDLVVMSYGGMGAILSSVPGNGDGTFGLATAYGLYDGILYPTSGLEAGDFDEDGHQDLAVTNLNSSDRGYVTVLFGNSTGYFARPDVWYGYNYDGTGFVIADYFDADSHLDLAWTNIAGGVSLYANEPGELGTFSSLDGIPFQGVMPRGLSSGDFDKDGDVDLVTVTSNGTDPGNQAAVSLNNGDGTFAEVVNYPSGVNPTGVISADFSGDGQLDLAVGHMMSNLQGTELGLLLGMGDGTFKEVTQYPASDVKPLQVSGPRTLTSGDFDNDGNLDIAMANVDGDDVTIFRRTGCEL